jgi:FMN phosphatase YigB (HAD superfamily)
MRRCLRIVLREYRIVVDSRRLEKCVLMTRRSFVNNGRPFNDTRPALEILRDQGHDLRIISNADMDLYKQLARMKLSSFFKPSITSYEARSYKPSRRIFLKALDMAHCTADDAVMVGDSIESDIAGASRVGMTTLLIDRDLATRPLSTRVHVRPDYLISDLREIGEKLSFEKLAC